MCYYPVKREPIDVFICEAYTENEKGALIMAQMSHTERIKAAIAFQDVDRVPAGIWGHRPFAEQDPIYLAEVQLDIALKHDFDFIKLNPDAMCHYYDFGVSSVMHTNPENPQKTQFRRTLMNTLDDWRAMPVLPAYYGNLGKTVNLTRYMQRFQKEKGVEIPYIVTVNSPLTNVIEVGCGLFHDPRAFIEMMKENEELFQEVLQKMTETGINYIKANMEYGPAGFFFATRFACYDYMTEEEYDKWGKPYDMQLFKVIESEPSLYFNMLHIHGQNAMWDKIANYPGNVINWHDAWIPPTLEEGRKLCHKCIEGGLHERELAGYTPQQVKEKVRDAVARAGRKGLIIGNGCGVWPWPSDENLHAITQALEEIG